MRFRLSAAFLLALIGALSISCGGIVDPSKNTVEGPFTGTLPPNGFFAYKFSASTTGEIQVKLITLTPAAVPVIGVQWVQASSDGNCNGSLLQNNTFATANSTVISGRIPSGTYCIVVYDSIGQSVTANYSLTISHP